MKASHKFIIKNIFKSLFTFSLACIVLWGCNSEKVEGYNFYDNDANGVSLIYPPDWEAHPQSFSDEKGAIGPLVVFQPSDKDSLIAHITVFTEVIPDSVKDADDYFNYSKGMLISQGLKIDIVKDGQAVINDRNSHWVELGYKQMEKNTKSLTYMFVVGGTGYNVSAVTAKESFEKLRPLFEKVSQSIKFN